jgi:HEAT repeat protein
MAEASQEEIQAAEELLRRFSLDVWGQEAELRPADHAAGLVHIFADRTREEGVRLKAYELLVRTETEPYKKVILAALSEPSEPIRATAVHGLPKVLSEDRLVEQYLALLKDRSGWVRYNAAEALQRHPTQEAVGPLLDLLADESIETRDRALGTLLSYKFPEIRSRLRALAQAADPTVAGAASFGLALLQGEDVHIPNLHRYLQQELGKLTGPPYYGVDDVVRVIRVLGEKKSPTSIPVLREAARHPHRDVREEADKAIETILQPAMAWGPAVQGLQCGIQREKAQVDAGGNLPVTLSVRNASPRQTVRLLKLESQKGFWGEALPLIVEFREPDGQWTPAGYRGPVLEPPPPPGRQAFIDLARRETDSIAVSVNLAHWGITMPGEVRVAFYQENRRDKTEAGDGPVEGLWVGRAVSGPVSVQVLSSALSKSIAELIGDLKGSDRELADAAMKELGTRGTVALPALVALVKDPSSPARDRAVISLGMIRNAGTTPFLIECLEDSDWQVRGRAAYALSQIGGQEARDALVKFLARCLKDNGVNLTKAAESLKELPDARAFDSLMTIVQEAIVSGRRGHHVYYAAEALGKIGDPRASGPLARLLNPNVPYHSSKDYLYLEAIHKTGGKEALPHLLAYLGALIDKMKGRPERPAPTHNLPVGAENRQTAYEDRVYNQTVACLEAITGRKSEGATREEALEYWQRGAREFEPRELF